MLRYTAVRFGTDAERMTLLLLARPPSRSSVGGKYHAGAGGCRVICAPTLLVIHAFDHGAADGGVPGRASFPAGPALHCGRPGGRCYGRRVRGRARRWRKYPESWWGRAARAVDAR